MEFNINKIEKILKNNNNLYSDTLSNKTPESIKEMLDSKVASQKNALGISSHNADHSSNLSYNGAPNSGAAGSPNTVTSTGAFASYNGSIKYAGRAIEDYQLNFINRIIPAAIRIRELYYIPISLTIAQAIIESGWGRSQLAAKYNNLFGVKGKGPAGSVNLNSNEKGQGGRLLGSFESSFRVYNNWDESILGYGKFLTGPRYKAVGFGTNTDPNYLAEGLVRAKYAGDDTTYGRKLINSYMKPYNLYVYDNIPKSNSGKFKD
jgi:flagellum-specific peptidoglycan hydrolase FlgJ